MAILRSDTHLQESLETIVRLLERHRVLDALAQNREGPRRELVEHLQPRQNLVELQRLLHGMHPRTWRTRSRRWRSTTGARLESS